MRRLSVKLGILIGLELKGMTECHVDLVLVLGKVFSLSGNHGHSFGAVEHWCHAQRADEAAAGRDLLVLQEVVVGKE